MGRPPDIEVVAPDQHRWRGVARLNDEEKRPMATDLSLDREPGASPIDRLAVEALRGWRSHVLGLTFEPDKWDGLVTWYWRLLTDPDYGEPAPVDELDRIADRLANPSTSHELFCRLADARWVLRVAEELARWRSSKRRGVSVSELQ